MFPGAGSQVYYNDEGEPLGWDGPDDFDGYEGQTRDEYDLDYVEDDDDYAE